MLDCRLRVSLLGWQRLRSGAGLSEIPGANMRNQHSPSKYNLTYRNQAMELTINSIASCAVSMWARGRFVTQNTPETAQADAVQPTHVTRHCARPVRRPLMAEYRKSRSAHRPCAVASGWAGDAGTLANKLGNLNKQYKINSAPLRIYLGGTIKMLEKIIL